MPKGFKGMVNINSNMVEDKIIQVTRVTKKDEDDISTVSSASYKGCFSSSSDDSEKESIVKYNQATTKRKNCIHNRTSQTSRRRK